MQIRLRTNPNLRIHNQEHFYDLPLQNQHGVLIENYLHQMQLTVDNALKDHPRSFAFRVDLRLPTQTEPFSSNTITKFIASLKAQVKADLIKRKKRYGRVHPCNLRYIWVKEKNKALNWHYHLLILLNKDCYHCLGDFKASSGNMASRIKKAWASAVGYELINIGGLVHFPCNPIYYIDRNAPSYFDKYDQLFYRISYFAKAETKNFGDHSNSFGCSQK